MANRLLTHANGGPGQRRGRPQVSPSSRPPSWRSVFAWNTSVPRLFPDSKSTGVAQPGRSDGHLQIPRATDHFRHLRAHLRGTDLAILPLPAHNHLVQSERCPILTLRHPESTHIRGSLRLSAWYSPRRSIYGLLIPSCACALHIIDRRNPCCSRRRRLRCRRASPDPDKRTKSGSSCARASRPTRVQYFFRTRAAYLVRRAIASEGATWRRHRVAPCFAPFGRCGTDRGSLGYYSQGLGEPLSRAAELPESYVSGSSPPM